MKNNIEVVWFLTSPNGKKHRKQITNISKIEFLETTIKIHCTGFKTIHTYADFYKKRCFIQKINNQHDNKK